MTEPQMTTVLPGRRRYRVEIAVLLTCLAVMAGFALLRSTRHGIRWEDHAEHTLGGNIHMFNNMNALFAHLSQVCLLCVVVVAILLMTVWHLPRVAGERAIAIISFWVLCLTSGVVAKRGFSHLISPDAGTLPSGHTTAALAACGAVLLATAGRWREFFVPAAAFMSSLYVISVVNSYVHRPGDALTAVALCSVWAVCVDMAAGGIRLPRAEHELPNRVLVTIGSATALITTIGWGSAMQAGLSYQFEGWIERIVLTCAGGLYVLYLARVADKLGGRVRG